MIQNDFCRKKNIFTISKILGCNSCVYRSVWWDRAVRPAPLPGWLPGYCYDQGRHRPAPAPAALYKVFDSLLERTKTSRVSPLGGSSIAHWTKPWNKENCDIILSIDGVDVSFLCLCTHQCRGLKRWTQAGLVKVCWLLAGQTGQDSGGILT